MIVEHTLPGWWAGTDEGIFIAEIHGLGITIDPPTPIVFWNYRTQKSSRVAVIEKPIHAPSVGLTASRDGKILIWAQTDHLESDLMLVDNFR